MDNNYNTGDHNTGDHNTGNYNTGYYNSGYHNTGHYNTGDHNTDSPTVRLFKKDSGWKFSSARYVKFKNIISSKLKPLCEWTAEFNMSDLEKQENPSYEVTGGYLKVNEALFNGNDFTKEEIEFLESVPNFCPEILKECTGLDITNHKKKIIIDGKEILINKESFEEIKRQFTDN